MKRRKETCGACALSIQSYTAAEETVICTVTGVVRSRLSLCTTGMFLPKASAQLTIHERSDR